MANCCNCSAPLPPNSIVCDYCGSRNDTDLRGIHYYTTHETESERICPRCRVKMRTINLKQDGQFLIERCDECLGLFFDPGELDALLDTTVSNVFEINRAQLDSINNTLREPETVVTYLKCPVCANLMNRVNYGAKSGVIVDRCREHGVWLDGGELRHLCEWVKAGGKLLDEQKKAERKNQEAEEERRRALADMTVQSRYPYEESNHSPDLVDVVICAARFLLKL